MQFEEMKTLSASYESSSGDVKARLPNEFAMLKSRFKAVGLDLSRGFEVLSADEIKSAQDAVVQGVVGPDPSTESTAQQQLTWYLLRVNFRIEKQKQETANTGTTRSRIGASAPFLKFMQLKLASYFVFTVASALIQSLRSRRSSQA